MVREALQSVFKYPPKIGTAISNRSRPSYQDVHHLFIESAIPLHSVTEKAYMIVFISALGLSALIICFKRIVSGNPFFPKGVVKMPRFRPPREYESLPTHIENGSGIHAQDRGLLKAEPLLGWRLRMGILQSIVLLALTLVHAVILSQQDEIEFRRTVLVIFWV